MYFSWNNQNLLFGKLIFSWRGRFLYSAHLVSEADPLDIDFNFSSSGNSNWITATLKYCFKRKPTSTKSCWLFRFNQTSVLGFCTRRFARITKQIENCYLDWWSFNLLQTEMDTCGILRNELISLPPPPSLLPPLSLTYI